MKKRKLKNYQLVFMSLILGTVFGLILSKAGGKDVAWIAYITDFCSFLGNIFIRLIRMIVVPLVFFSITAAVLELKDLKQLKRIGIKTFLLFSVTSAIAIAIGITLAYIIKPGQGIVLETAASEINVAELPGIYDTLLDIIPLNIFEAFTKGSMLQIIFFAIMLGIAIILLGEQGKKVEQAFKTGANIMYKIIDIIVLYIPIGVFGLMTDSMATYGTSVLGTIFKFILTEYSAAFLQVLLIYIPMIIFITKVNPIKYLKVVFESWLVGFSTCTSMAALPVSMKNAKEKLGIPNEIASFVLPFGATANMDGTGIFFGVVIIFAAQFAGVELSFMQILSLILEATLLSIGCAAVPQVGLVIGTTILISMGLPVEVVGLITGIYRILDQIHTATNVSGDLVVAGAVSSLEGTLNRSYYEKDSILVNELEN
ncbi:dicarboxylate/amino acid:cation symporter [Caproiciproducens sp. MSJ-32]|uniref:dicarboxylate/amino acid:cation symporter n=1 Tax=Caproiciproducens sp. MSJ-32 TaxID=2841527 RepID=UPI001C11488C|nr:dicarboxylate/amino acid:cation symporter [Caproiciproducens sp. MSJ-32]MBU5455599.1 dicarboxylate/amino acid:cation symporter [Caproiciproducens sp. MSJ-32]